MGAAEVCEARGKARKDFEEKVTDLIVDMGDIFDEEQRLNSVYSIVEDYEELTEEDAEDFIKNNEYLIENGELP